MAKWVDALYLSSSPVCSKQLGTWVVVNYSSFWSAGSSPVGGEAFLSCLESSGRTMHARSVICMRGKIGREDRNVEEDEGRCDDE